MAKTDETLKLEKEIWEATHKQGVFCCFEVTIGWFGSERVDYLTYDTKGVFRCYEIKVSKSDFRSKAKKTFVGHYNYYVIPEGLFEEVKAEIPTHIGVYIGKYLVKRAKKQELAVEEQVLKDSLIRSLSREVEKQIKSNDPLVVNQLNRRISSLETDRNNYRKMYFDLSNEIFEKYGSRWNK